MLQENLRKTDKNNKAHTEHMLQEISQQTGKNNIQEKMLQENLQETDKNNKMY